MNNTIINSRVNFEKLGTRYKPADAIRIEKERIDTIPCYWFYNHEQKTTNRLIVYLHGGCFVLGSINSHRALVSHICKELNIPVLFIDYCLAPEHPYPTAVNEIVKVYKQLLNRDASKEIIFMGDSAGAGLSVSVISMLNKERITPPGQLVMFSPWIDLRGTYPSVIGNAATDPVLTKEQLLNYGSLYIGHNKIADANPVETMEGTFPPTLIVVGSGEILLDDSRVIAEKIAAQQTRVRLSIYENQTHVWPFENIDTPASKKAINEINAFIQEQ